MGEIGFLIVNIVSQQRKKWHEIENDCSEKYMLLLNASILLQNDFLNL